MLTFGSLFAGIGGFDLGFERAGMTCLWQVEIDDYCNRVLAKHWPDVERYLDVRECGKHNLKPVDVICGGFPCQPHSYAGKRKGAKDDRDLWPEYRRIIDEVRPRWIVAENVLGIRTTILDEVLSDLEGLGYSTATTIIPACAVDAPHRRDRVWIVAYSDNQRLQGRDGEIMRECADEWTSRTRSPSVAHANTIGRNGWTRQQSESGGGQPENSSEWFPKSSMGGMVDGLSRWLDEPRNVPRVATGVPNRVNRLKTLGNAVVSQVAEFIGRLIVEVEAVANHDGKVFY